MPLPRALAPTFTYPPDEMTGRQSLWFEEAAARAMDDAYDQGLAGRLDYVVPVLGIESECDASVVARMRNDLERAARWANQQGLRAGGGNG